VAVDDEGRIFVTDTGNHRVQQFTLAGEFAFASGQPGSGGGEFSNPAGIAINREEQLHIADTGNHRIQTFDSSIGFIRSFGTFGVANGQFSSPQGVSANTFFIYVADSENNRIQKIATENIRDEDDRGTGLRFLQVIDNLALNGPRGVAAGSDTTRELIYIADTGNHRVLKVEVPIPSPEETWNRMRVVLFAEDLEGALEHFVDESKGQYRQVFKLLGDRLPATVREMGNFELDFIEGRMRAEGLVSRMVEGQKITFPIVFVFREGRWLIINY
jgi:DNA-binding beta-propeller fold protein YncE